MHRRPSHRTILALTGAVALAITSCGGGESADVAHTTGPAATVAPPATAAAPTSTVPTEPTSGVTAPAAPAPSPSTVTPAGSTAAPTIPTGSVLRVADQYGLFAGILGFAGTAADAPYAIEYVTLPPGVVQLQAFQAGEVDVGVISALGLLQAANGDIDVRAVARWRTDFALYALVTAPGVDDVTDWTSLRGRRLALQRNTTAEALAMLALDTVGMTLDDVTVVDVPHHQVSTTLERGDADAGVTSEPFVSAYRDANPTARYVLGIDGPAAQSTLVVAADRVLDDPARTAVVTDYLRRLDAAFVELTTDRDAFAELAVTVWALDRTSVDEVLAESNGVRMDDVPGDLAEPFDRLAELLAERGDVPADLDLASRFDGRFAELFVD